jgi:hemolysin activation/secretion protein
MIDSFRRAGAPLLMLALMTTVAALAAPPAAAQSASQITPHSLAPPIQGNAQGGIAVTETDDLRTPPGADQLFVTLAGVSISADSPELTSIGATVRDTLVGQRVSGAQIFAAARKLEAAYAKAGYVLVRVVLPPQQLRDGTQLRLRVVDGFIERIDTAGVSERVRGRISRIVGPLISKRGLKLAEIERRILLASDTPGVILRSTLGPGSETGAAVLIIDGKYQPIDGSLNGDNSLSQSLGGYQLGVGIDANSVLDAGELAYLRADGDPTWEGDGSFFSSKARNRMLAAGIIVPLGIDGTTFNVEVTQARTTPTRSDDTQSTDLFERLSLRLRYPWIRARDFDLASQFVFDAQSENEDLLLPAPLPLFDDRLRIVRLAQEWDGINAIGGALSGGFTMSFGFDGLGARSAGAATPLLPLSRQGAGANFAKIDGSLRYSQSFTPHLNAQISIRGQDAFGRSLERSEEIGIADPDSLSAFDAGSLQGDSGFVVRAEVASPWLVANSGRSALLASPYAFEAQGEVYEANPTVLEAPQIHAGAYGAGLRLGEAQAGSRSNGSLNVEVARQTGGYLRDVTRVRIAAVIKF